MLVKLYGNHRENEATYSPAQCIGSRTVEIRGARIANIFYQSRRAAQFDNANAHAPLRTADECIQQEIENHVAMLALYFMYYNFCRVHQTLRVTPAMEAGLTDHVWSVEEIVALLGEK